MPFSQRPFADEDSTKPPRDGDRIIPQLRLTDFEEIAGTRERENPYRTGLSGNRRERPGPRFAGSIPVGARIRGDASCQSQHLRKLTATLSTPPARKAAGQIPKKASKRYRAGKHPGPAGTHRAVHRPGFGGSTGCTPPVLGRSARGLFSLTSVTTLHLTRAGAINGRGVRNGCAACVLGRFDGDA